MNNTFLRLKNFTNKRREREKLIDTSSIFLSAFLRFNKISNFVFLYNLYNNNNIPIKKFHKQEKKNRKE